MQSRDLRQSDERYTGTERRAAEGPRRLTFDRRDPPEAEEDVTEQLLVELIRSAERARERQQELYDRELEGIGRRLGELGKGLERERRWRTGLLLALLVVAFLADPATVLQGVATVVRAL